MSLGVGIGGVSSQALLSQSVQEQLIRAEDIFDNFAEATQSDKDRIVICLKSAFAEIGKASNDGSLPKHLERTVARILYLYGRCLYGSMSKCQPIFELSLAVHWTSLSLLQKPLCFLDKPLDTLPYWLKNQTAQLQEMEGVLLNRDTETLAAAIFSHKEPEAQQIGETLRFLVQSYEGLERFLKGPAIRFEKVYGLARTIFERLDTRQSSWEMGQLIYHSGPFMHRLQFPNDPVGAIATLQQALPFLAKESNTVRAKVFEAKIRHDIAKVIASIYSITVAKPTEIRRQVAEFCHEQEGRAVQLAKETPEFDPFLRSMFCEAQLSFAMSCVQLGSKSVTANEMETLIEKHMRAIKEEGYTHYYQASLALRAVECVFNLGKIEAAKTYLAIAAEIQDKFPDRAFYDGQIAEWRAKLGSNSLSSI